MILLHSSSVTEKMSRLGSFLLSRSEVLSVYNDEYFNRVTLVNNISPVAKSRCWVHQSSSDLRSFDRDEELNCCCGYDLEGSDRCAQRLYVEDCIRRATVQKLSNDKAGIVTFGNTRCVGLILPEGVYLFSSIAICDANNQAAPQPEKTQETEHNKIVCTDCRASMEVSEPVLEDTVAALKKLLRSGDATQEGITLMQQFPINTRHLGELSAIYSAIERAQEAAKSVGALEGLVPETYHGNSLEQTIDVELIEGCVELAELLIESIKTELVAVCSSVVGMVKSYSQPPLKIKLRWLRHYMALEYHVEFSADLTNCFYDEITGRYSPDLNMENVVLHEIVQCSKLSMGGVEDCFRLALTRLRDFLAVRRIFNSKSDSDAATQIVNDTLSSTSSDVTPFWWKYYGFSNTLGEGENAPENFTLKRLTRSQSLKIPEDGASTPVARKSRNTLDYPLVATHCISSDNLAHSRGTTLETQSDHRKQVGDITFGDGVSPSLNDKAAPLLLNQSLKGASIDQKDDNQRATNSRVCFCFKCLESVSTLGRHFGTRDFRQENHLITAVFGEIDLATELGDLYNGYSGENWDECKTTAALRNSIRAAVNASSSLGRAILDDPGNAKTLVKQSIKILNTALLSSLRLGDFIHSSRNSAEMKLEENSDSVKEFYDLGEGMEEGEEVSDDSSSSESTLRDIISNSFVVGNNPLQELYSTFENDQYIPQDLDDPEEVSAVGSKSFISRTPKRKSSSPKPRRCLSNIHNSSIDSSSETSGRQSRKCTRESLSNNEMYVYDLSERNDAASESPVDDWYDSDGSARGSRKPRQKPSTSSLTEIYGAQDALIPMGPLPIGVYFDASRKLWRCQWRENGKFRTKGFSLGHYESLCEARRACILFRCQVGNMQVQPEWLNPNYVQVSQLISKRAAGAASAANTPKKSRRKRKPQLAGVEVDPIK